MKKEFKGKENQVQMQRANSHAHFSYSNNKTLAELNHVSTKETPLLLHPKKALRITLPDYFNVPRFTDARLLFSPSSNESVLPRLQNSISVKKKLKDLGILAEGMKRAKNIKEESRCYYTQGVLLHNAQLYSSAVESFQKFLKIVLFIKDEMSVELALNAIGIEYMQMGQPERAVDYHLKQAEMSRSNQFLGRTNTGICLQMVGRNQEALEQYQEAREKVFMEKDEAKLKYIDQLIERVQSKIEQERHTADPTVFMTEQEKKETSQSKQVKKIDLSPYAYGLSPKEGKATERRKYDTARRGHSNGKQFDRAKVSYAIEAAQESMDEYMETMKKSLIVE